MKNNKRYFILISLVGALILVFIQRLYIGIMQDYLIEKLGLTLRQLSNLSSSTLYGYAIMQIPVGILVDKVGVRKVTIWGMALTFLSSILFTYATSYTLAIVARFFIGVGTSVVVVSIMKVQALWFDKKDFSKLSSIVSFIGNLGMLLATVPLAYFISIFGEKNALIAIIVLTFMVLASVVLFVEDKNIEKEEQESRVFNSIKEVVLNKCTYPPLLIIMFFVSTMTSFTSIWGITYLVNEYSLSTIDASKYMSFLSLGFILGAFLVGVMDKVFKGDYKKNLKLFTFIYLLLWVYVLIIKKGNVNLRILPIIFILMGICIMFHLLAFTAVKDVNKLENSGVATATINMSEFIGSGILNLAIALLIDSNFSYSGSLFVIIIYSFISFISSLFIDKSNLDLE
ncbi:MFS transporter [Alkalithermobacter paradoxus]|uniref:Putative sulfoacetate transporter SauU n=1 Tax=Alkalithermobacter paradoxus TaxID=29349 RepID=A0A1V4IAG1_9FIRM|nr:putative sulfoacetate transporter SauU [[Clostridium] thermoalcaliphilum]